jgi:hypothetical protein
VKLAGDIVIVVCRVLVVPTGAANVPGLAMTLKSTMLRRRIAIASREDVMKVVVS